MAALDGDSHFLASVRSQFDEPLIGNAKEVGDLMHDGVADLLTYFFW